MYALLVYDYIIISFNGIPMIDRQWVAPSDTEFWKGVATLERLYSMPTLLQSFVTVDYKNVSKNALYVNQVSFSFGYLYTFCSTESDSKYNN